jgi:hypothetical protein
LRLTAEQIFATGVEASLSLVAPFLTNAVSVRAAHELLTAMHFETAGVTEVARVTRVVLTTHQSREAIRVRAAFTVFTRQRPAIEARLGTVILTDVRTTAVKVEVAFCASA